MFRTVLGIIALFALSTSATAGSAVPSGQIENLWTLTALVVSVTYVCGLIWLRKSRMSPALRRMQQVSGDPLYFDAILSLLFHIARNDGVISKDNLEAIRNVYRDATGAEVTSDMTASHFARFSTDASILNLVSKYRGIQAETLMDAAILAATHDGCIPTQKKAFLTELSHRLGTHGDWFDRRLAAALCPEARAARGLQTMESIRL